MPTFDFFCPTCRVAFSKFVRDRETRTYPCPSCQEDAGRQISEVGFAFGDGKHMGNTGVYYLDSSVDHNVGRDAKRKWELIKDREAAKGQVREDLRRRYVRSGTIGAGEDLRVAMRQDPVTGEYQPMSVEEVRANARLRSEFNETFDRHVADREARGVPKHDSED